MRIDKLQSSQCVTPTVQNHRDWLESNAKRSAEYYNRTAGPELPTLLPGVKVMMQDPEKSVWNPGTIKEVCPEPRSYLVQTPNGGILRRNRRFLKEISQKPNEKLTFRENMSDIADPDVTGSQVDNAEPTVGESVRRSSRTVVKPKRYIEECAMRVENAQGFEYEKQMNVSLYVVF